MLPRVPYLLLAVALAGACGQGEGIGPHGAASSAASVAPAASAGPTAAASDPAAVREGSAIARSPADDWLYVADEDHQAIRVLALPLAEDGEVTSVAMPGRPAQLVVTAGRVLVTIRDLEGGGGALLAMKREGRALGETARVALPPDAWGLALSPDGATAVVTSAWSAKVSVVDLGAMRVRATLDVAREPRGVTILDGTRAFVSHLVGSAITEIVELDGATPRVERRELPASPLRSLPSAKLPASLGYAVIASPDGQRLFFPRHALGAVGGDAWFGTAAVDVWLPAKGEALAAPATMGVAQVDTWAFRELHPDSMKWMPFNQRFTDSGAKAFVQPRAAAYRKSTQTLLVASEGTNALVELDALMTDPTTGWVRRYELGRGGRRIYKVATKGAAPTGVALSQTEDVAYVYCRASDDVAAVTLTPGIGTSVSVAPLMVRVAEPPEESLAIGRALFYDATDEVTSGGLGCAGCHPEGRDDGHVWHETAILADSSASDPKSFVNFLGSATNFVELQKRWNAKLDVAESEAAPAGVGYARQTPMLAGRVASAGPYGWHAENPDIQARIIAGMSLHRWSKRYDDEKTNIASRAVHLAVFLRQGLVPPLRQERELTPEEEQGKTIFTSAAAQCATCHVPASEFTDRFNPPLPQPPPPPGFAVEKDHRYRTPSLLFLGSTPPYFHDGRYQTLEEMVEHNGDRMGKLSHLSREEKKALVAYLRTL